MEKKNMFSAISFSEQLRKSCRHTNIKHDREAKQCICRDCGLIEKEEDGGTMYKAVKSMG
jgi:hypothetical protein